MLVRVAPTSPVAWSFAVPLRSLLLFLLLVCKRSSQGLHIFFINQHVFCSLHGIRCSVFLSGCLLDAVAPGPWCGWLTLAGGWRFLQGIPSPLFGCWRPSW